jgi:hypothetical protein
MISMLRRKKEGYNVTGIETPDHIVKATMNQLQEGDDSLY